MKVIISHGHYQIAGGEDSVLKQEIELLGSQHNELETYVVNNSCIKSSWDKLKTAISVPFSFSQLLKIKHYLRNEQADIVHVHNYFPLLSPAIFFACKSVGTPVVHTLHNYRAICPTALLMHEGEVEERSLHSSSWWTVYNKVYRNSFWGTFALACMVEFHKKIGTWHSKVDRYIALTEFSKSKYIEAGWPAEKIVVKPNFIKDPFPKLEIEQKQGGYALFVGRISKEKGVETLLSAWNKQTFPLKVVGDGPLKNLLTVSNNPAVEYLGPKAKDEVLDLIRNADFIIMPSTWYEGFPMVLVEAFACGTPAVVSRLGSMEEIVEDHVTGLHFQAGNPEDLASKSHQMIEKSSITKDMGANARREYLENYTPEKNYRLLMDIYQQAIDESQRQL